MTFKERFANMQNAGGNHQAQSVQGILMEGRKSYEHTKDQVLGTKKAANAFSKDVKQITPPQPKKVSIKR